MAVPRERRQDPDVRRGEPRRPRWSWWLYPVITVVTLILLFRVFGGAVAERRIDYSTFIAHLDSGRVASVEIGNREIRGRLVQDTLASDSAFVTNRIDHPELVSELRRHGVAFSGQPGSDWPGTIIACRCRCSCSSASGSSSAAGSPVSRAWG